MRRGISGTLRNKILAALAVALGALCLSLALRHLPLTSALLERLDFVGYDWFYRLRPTENRTSQPIIIAAVDDKSVDWIDQNLKFGWPWPREFWGRVCQYLDKAGAKVIVFDISFQQRSVYQNELGDDDNFAELVKAVKTPIVFASHVKDGTNAPFAPPIVNPIFGATNVLDDRILRDYPQTVGSSATLARKAVEIVDPEATEKTPDPFFLHYHGPHQDAKGNRTYKYLAVGALISAAINPEDKSVDPSIFKDKIVILGAIHSGAYDLKSMPLSPLYPGVEVHATAIDNLLSGQFVKPVPLTAQIPLVLGLCLAASSLIILPRPPMVKMIAAIVVPLILIALCIVLFRGQTIRFLPPAFGLLAVGLTVLSGFIWSYRIEDRERRFMLKALARYVSPRVADELSKDPGKLALGGQQKMMTVMFTDAAGFTQLSETLHPDQVGRLMNFYLDEQSSVVLKADATLDKFIGDAIMCFWNAPLDQPDHALIAAKAAIAMQKRCDELQEQFKSLGAKNGLYMRVGISTGPMVVGNMGSSQRFSYTVLGDAVNYASRLEGANKFFGTRILLSEETARLVKPHLPMRRLDLVRVKGRAKGEFISELLVDTSDTQRQFASDYEAAWELYRNRNWDAAENSLLAILTNFGDDLMSQQLLQRVKEYQAHPPGPDWDGSYTLTEK